MKIGYGYKIKSNTLVHLDIRADNCPWNQKTKKLKLIDWNWSCLGDSDLEYAIIIVSAYNSGLKVPNHMLKKLNRGTLIWLAGNWLSASIEPVWEGGNISVRNLQAKSGTTAYSLSEKLI